MLPSVIISLALFIQLHCIYAIPFNRLTRILPRHVTHVALDETNEEFIAFTENGIYGRYPASTQQASKRAAAQCANLSLDELKTLPGWNALEQYRKDNWGDGSQVTVTNPPDYPDSPALACATTDTVDVSFDGDPVCQTSTVNTSGQLVGTKGSVAIAVTQGFESTGSYTVETASTIGLSSTLSVEVGIPEVASVTAEMTISTEITNTQTTTFETKSSNLQTVTLTIDAPEGQTCNAVTSIKTCTIQASGKLRYLAQGWVWYNYDDQTQGHYKWAAHIDAVLTNPDDRSSFATFKGNVEAKTEAAYKGTCA